MLLLLDLVAAQTLMLTLSELERKIRNNFDLKDISFVFVFGFFQSKYTE